MFTHQRIYLMAAAMTALLGVIYAYTAEACPSIIAGLPNPDEWLTSALGFVAIGNMSGDSIHEMLKKAIDRQEEFVKKHTNDLDKLEKDIKAIGHDFNEIEARLNRYTMLGSHGPATNGHDPAEIKAMGDFVRYGDTGELRAIQAERKGMFTGSSPDGGFLVPSAVDTQIETYLRNFSPMRTVADVRQLDIGGEYKVVVNKGTGNDAAWVDEIGDRADSANPALAEITIPAREMYAMPKISQTLLDDAMFNAAEWLIGEIAERFQLLEGAAFISGDGVKKPRGILTYDTDTTADGVRAFGKIQRVHSLKATEIDPDSLVNIVYSVKSGYRAGSVWMMNSTTAAHVMKIKDGSGNFYLWNHSLSQAQPPTLLGYPVYLDENLPDVAAGEFPILFGNVKRAYRIIDRRATAILRDPYTSKPFVRFYATRRIGGGVVNFDAVKLLKIAA